MREEKALPLTVRPRCSCGRLARYFGQFAGGMCEKHALGMIDDQPDAMGQFWPEHRQALRDAQARGKEVTCKIP